MNEIRNILKKKGLHPKSYEKKQNVYIIDTNDGKYVIKKNTNNCDIYDYLNTRGFYNYPVNCNLKEDNYDLSRYIEDMKIPPLQRMEDLIEIIGSLHNKTSYYQETDLDEIKKIYENIKQDLFNSLNYYNDLNDYLDTITFLSPPQYLLLRNISLIYYMISYSERKIDEWYKMVSQSKRIRTCLTHNNISFEHLLINEHKYLISWDKSRIDKPINDLISFYKQYYSYFKLEDVFRIYENNNCLYEEEKALLLVYLSIPKKHEFTSNHLQDVSVINQEILFLKKVYEYIKNDQIKV